MKAPFKLPVSLSPQRRYMLADDGDVLASFAAAHPRP